jgi:hypothetical protein
VKTLADRRRDEGERATLQSIVARIEQSPILGPCLRKDMLLAIASGHLDSDVNKHFETARRRAEYRGKA